MKKNVYLTILTVVTVLCIIGGSCYHIVGWGLNVLSDVFSFWKSDKEEAGPVVDSDSGELGDFTSISVDADIMSLTVVPGDSAAISYKGNEKLAPKYEIDGDALVITQTGKVNSFWGSKKCNVTLTVPEAACFRSIEIYSAVGDIDLSGLQGEFLSLDADVGDIDVDGCRFTDIEITASVGDVDMEDCTFTTLAIDADVGDIDVDSAADLSEYEISLDTDMGEVCVNDRDYRKSYEQDGTSAGQVTITNSMGDISLEY